MTALPILALAAILIPAAALADITGPARVIDGDTIEIQDQRIRLFGIDAPERKQTCREQRGTRDKEYPCGRHATAFLASLVDGESVICVEEDRDRYKRIVATCFANGRDLGMALVAAGWAVAYTRFTVRYIAAQESARARKVGMWSGTFVEPELWRRKKR